MFCEGFSAICDCLRFLDCKKNVHKNRQKDKQKTYQSISSVLDDSFSIESITEEDEIIEQDRISIEDSFDEELVIIDPGMFPEYKK